MKKDFFIYNELAAAAVKVFNEGIDAPAVPAINLYVIGSVKNRETRKNLKSSNKKTI